MELSQQRFSVTDDPWNISAKDWQRIGEDQRSSSSTLLAAFGHAPHDFAKHCHEFTAEGWKQQATLFLPIYLHGLLLDKDYLEFCNLIEAIFYLFI